MISGIYQISNKKTGWRYIGSATNVANRWATHRNELNAGKHSNSILQRSWDKHGEEAFEFSIIEEVPKEALLVAEQHWIDITWGKKLYNRRRDASSNLGVRHTPESKKRMSEAQRALPVTPAKIAARNAHGNKIRGRKQSEIHKQKIAEGNRGKVNSPEAIDRMRRAALNRSEDHTSKISESLSKNWIVTDPEGVETKVRNLTQWAKERGLIAPHLYSVAKGERKHHRQYKVRRED